MVSLSLSHKLKNQDPFCFLQCTCLLQSNITVFVVVQFLFITDLLSHSPYSSLSPSCFSCSLLNFISQFILRNPFGLQYLSFSFFPSEYCKCLLISSFTLIYTKQVSSQLQGSSCLAEGRGKLPVYRGSVMIRSLNLSQSYANSSLRFAIDAHKRYIYLQVITFTLFSKPAPWS